MNAFFAVLIFVAMLFILMGFYFLFMFFLRREKREILVRNVQTEPQMPILVQEIVQEPIVLAVPPQVVQQVIQEQLVPAPQVQAAPLPPVNAEASNTIYQAPPPPIYTEPAPVAVPPQALVQRPAILDVANPIVQAVLPESLPATGIPVPDMVNTTNLSEDKSPAGVRYSSNPSGRHIRDRRRNRNASN